MREFWGRGYAGVTTAQLASAIGINQPSLYAAFGDKATLFAEASDLYATNLDRSLGEALAARHVRAAMAALLRSAVLNFTREDAPHGCLIMREPLLAERRRATREAILRRFEAAVADGEVRNTDEARALADYVNGVLAGIAARALDGAKRDELQRIADLALEALPRTNVVTP